MPAATRNADHLAEDCRDDNCPRFPCRIWRQGYVAGFRIGYQQGYAEGYAQGYEAGYAAGFAAGQANCGHSR